MIHHSNPKCDVCGQRHTPDDTGECLDCVLAQASEDIAHLKAVYRGALQRCINAMTMLLDVEVPSSTGWAELRRVRDAAKQMIVDECGG